jgi:hypothetical protein
MRTATIYRPPGRGGGTLTPTLLGLALGVLGLLGGVPYFLGTAVAAAGVLGSVYARRRRPSSRSLGPLVPALLSLVVLTATAPASAATELFAGLSGLAFLVWVADEPTRPAGGGRRAAGTIGSVALAIGLVWGIGLGFGGRTEALGLAGALIATGLIVLVLLAVSVSERPLEDDERPRRRTAPGARATPEEEPFPWER